MKGHETRRGSHGKKRDDKVQQKGRGVTESKGNAKESGSCHSPVETAAPRQVAVAAGCPAASRSGGKKSHPEERCTPARWSSGLYSSDGKVPGYGQES